MATNNFKPFATGVGANVSAQADYEALAALFTGFQAGKASSAQVNKALRQGTVMAAVLASFISSNAGVDVLDNGDTATLIANLQSAVFNNTALKGVPTAPTAVPGTNSTQIATTAFAYYLVSGLLGVVPDSLNTLQKIAAAINNDPNYYTSVANALGLKAPLASPALTGVPTAPTAAPGTNTTQIATTAYAYYLVSGILGVVPDSLNTMQKIAAAINNDPNYFTSVANALAFKAPLASPALTGVPTAPTAAPGTNTTQIATTAFAQAIATAIVGIAPASLNTLQALAAAINNDPSYSTSVANAITALLPKRGFTGTDFIRIPDAANGLLIQFASVAVPDGADGTDATAVYFSWKTAMTRPLVIFSGISGSIANRASNAAFNGSTGGKLVAKNQGTGLGTTAYVLAIGQE